MCFCFHSLEAWVGSPSKKVSSSDSLSARTFQRVATDAHSAEAQLLMPAENPKLTQSFVVDVVNIVPVCSRFSRRGNGSGSTQQQLQQQRLDSRFLWFRIPSSSIPLGVLRLAKTASPGKHSSTTSTDISQVPRVHCSSYSTGLLEVR